MNGSDKGHLSEEDCFPERLGFNYSHCSDYSPFFSMSSFFHDGVNEAFAESVSASRSQFSLFCLRKVITDDLSNQEQKQFYERQYQS